MTEGYDSFGPMLPIYAQLPALLLLLLFLWTGLRLVESRVARFLIFAIWIRFILSNFHALTFPKFYSGFSINAVASAGLIVLGLIIIRKASLLSKGIAPVYLLFATLLLSTFLNHRFNSSIDVLLKYAYFLVVALATAEALKVEDGKRFGTALLLAFSPLLVFQLLSVALGVSKPDEITGAPSYIGGYNHEAAFSVSLVALFVAASLVHNLNHKLRWILLVASLLGIFLANYRTAILAALPLLAYHILRGISRRFEPHLRPFVMSIVVVLIVGTAVSMIFSLERFYDLRIILNGEASVIKPPEDFTDQDRNLLSGRARLWSHYLYAWADGGPVQTLVGFGPNSWVGRFWEYAHNTFVGVLFEYGLIGEAALLIVVASGFWMSLMGDPQRRGTLVAAHSGFILLNLATMPFWQVEGLLLYGVLWGYTMHSFFSHRIADSRRVQPSDFAAVRA